MILVFSLYPTLSLAFILHSTASASHRIMYSILLLSTALCLSVQQYDEPSIFHFDFLFHSRNMQITWNTIIWMHGKFFHVAVITSAQNVVCISILVSDPIHNWKQKKNEVAKNRICIMYQIAHTPRLGNYYYTTSFSCRSFSLLFLGWRWFFCAIYLVALACCYPHI